MSKILEFIGLVVVVIVVLIAVNSLRSAEVSVANAPTPSAKTSQINPRPIQGQQVTIGVARNTQEPTETAKLQAKPQSTPTPQTYQSCYEVPESRIVVDTQGRRVVPRDLVPSASDGDNDGFACDGQLGLAPAPTPDSKRTSSPPTIQQIFQSCQDVPESLIVVDTQGRRAVPRYLVPSAPDGDNDRFACGGQLGFAPAPTPEPNITPTDKYGANTIRLTLTELLDEYEGNKVRANSRLRYQENGNMPVATSGYIYQVEDLYAVITPTKDARSFRDLRCYYTDTGIALHLTKGQSVSITGRVRGTGGVSSTVYMFACEFDGIVLESNPTVAAHDLRGNVVQVFCTTKVLVFSLSHKGTGVIIDAEEGIVVTVHHVVADENECQKIEVQLPGSQGRVPATIVRHCASIDRARIRIPPRYLAGLSPQPIVRATAPAQTDQKIYFWGYGPGKLRMETGIVTGVFYSEFVTDAYGVPGDSGSPVFNESGHLLGTVSSGNRSDRTVFTGHEC